MLTPHSLNVSHQTETSSEERTISIRTRPVKVGYCAVTHTL